MFAVGGPRSEGQGTAARLNQCRHPQEPTGSLAARPPGQDFEKLPGEPGGVCGFVMPYWRDSLREGVGPWVSHRRLEEVGGIEPRSPDWTPCSSGTEHQLSSNPIASILGRLLIHLLSDSVPQLQMGVTLTSLSFPKNQIR